MPGLQINGWTIIAHPLFIDQFKRLVVAVENSKGIDPDGYKTTTNAKLLAALIEIMTRRIPSDPTLKRYRQGMTLGEDYKHWFRDKFGNGRFRIFFRYDSPSKIIAFVWVNDKHTKRTYGAKDDAYTVFAKMLKAGHPPDSWQKLKNECVDMQLVLDHATAISSNNK